MPFHLIDMVLGGSMLTFAVVVALISGYLTYRVALFDDGARVLAALFVFAVSVVIVTGLLGRAINWMYPLAPGVFTLREPNRRANVWKLMGFLYLFNLSILINTYLCPVNIRWMVYRFLGSRIGNNVIMGGKIVEPLMVSVGNNTLLGEDSLIVGHVIARDEVTLGRVEIGNHVTIGVKAVIMPDVQIGDGAVVWAGAVVPKGARIGLGEDWAGVPARRVIGARDAQTQSAPD